MAVAGRLLPFATILFIILLLGYKKTMGEPTGTDAVPWGSNKGAKLQCCSFNYIGRCKPNSPDELTSRKLCRQSSCGDKDNGGNCLLLDDDSHDYACNCPCPQTPNI